MENGRRFRRQTKRRRKARLPSQRLAMARDGAQLPTKSGSSTAIGGRPDAWDLITLIVYCAVATAACGLGATTDCTASFMRRGSPITPKMACRQMWFELWPRMFAD